MKFAIAAAAIAATSSFVGVHASSSTSSSSSTSKSGKGSCSSSPKLEKFCNEEPANFAGNYDVCYSNVIRNSASGFRDGVSHRCDTDNLQAVFTALDSYGAYETSFVDLGAGVVPGEDLLWKFQGIAQGNTIKMTSFGGGVVNFDGDIILPNETPDTNECTLYDDGILKCITYFEEYCGPNTANETFLPSDCEDGEWLVTYTIESVAVLEGFECPEAPAGFCDDERPDRKLQEEEASHLCPILNGKMN